MLWEETVRKPIVMLTAATAVSILTFPTLAELGSSNPDDPTLRAERETEAGSTGSGIFDIPVPDPSQTYQPAERVRRGKFGVVGPIMQNGVPTGLQLQDLDALVYPSTSTEDKAKLFEGMKFFTMFHDAGEGLGPLNNQPACVGCHLTTA